MNRSGPLERRTALAARKPLERRTALGASSGSLRPSEPLGRGKGLVRKPSAKAARRRAAPGRTEWLTFRRYGKCECCGRYGIRDPHHVLLEQYVEMIRPEAIFDLRNRWLLGRECCHAGHHSYGTRDTRLPRAKVPASAVAFVRELLGPAADGYLQRRYRAA